MSEELTKLSQSIVEIAKEVDGSLNNYGKNTPNEDTAAVVGARLALDVLLKQARELDEILYKACTEDSGDDHASRAIAGKESSLLVT